MGRYLSTILCVFLFLFAVSNANAVIQSWNCIDDGDTAVSTPVNSLTGSAPDYTFNMAFTQFWGPGHMSGDFTTDTETDPTVWLIQEITNDTGWSWTDYHITIGMDKAFTISTTSGLVGPDGWQITVVQPVADQPLPGDISPGLGWVGTVNFVNQTGSAIADGEYGDFGFKFSFVGTTNFWTAQVPTPEPTTILLLGLGAMSVIRRRR